MTNTINLDKQRENALDYAKSNTDYSKAHALIYVGDCIRELTAYLKQRDISSSPVLTDEDALRNAIKDL